MFAPDDTIVAIATASGRGALGLVRISGPQAPAVAGALLNRSLEARHATLARLTAGAPGAALDQVVATWFPAPHSYTGQHVVELGAHGSPVVLEGIVQRAIAAGARLAAPGEFTLRAFLHGKMDLVQAEAVADLIEAATPLQARIAFDQLEGTLSRKLGEIDTPLFDLIVQLEASLDFPDEGYHFVEPGLIAARIESSLECIETLLGDARRGRMIREGATVVIAGRTNVGKSSLFNALAGSDRAIVTEVAGTTRDLLTERVSLDGLLITLTDTAGARVTADIVEREGVSRGARARQVADLVLLVVDGSEPLTVEDEQLIGETAGMRRLIVVNKCDCASVHDGPPGVRVSALTGEGLGALRAGIEAALVGGERLRDTAAIANLRHVALLERAHRHLRDAHASASAAMPEECVLTDLHGARACFDEIVGTRTADDVLSEVFARFCIGK